MNQRENHRISGEDIGKDIGKREREGEIERNGNFSK